MAWERDWTPRHWTGFTLIAASLMLVTPLWNVWAPAMPDYPAHLASFALIEQGMFHRGAAIAPGLGGLIADEFGLIYAFYFMAVTIIIANVFVFLTPAPKR